MSNFKFNFPESHESKEHIPTKVEKWYDKNSKNWIIQVLDQDGNQIKCEYAGSKKSAEYSVKTLKQEYGL